MTRVPCRGMSPLICARGSLHGDLPLLLVPPGKSEIRSTLHLHIHEGPRGHALTCPKTGSPQGCIHAFNLWSRGWACCVYPSGDFSCGCLCMSSHQKVWSEPTSTCPLTAVTPGLTRLHPGEDPWDWKQGPFALVIVFSTGKDSRVHVLILA